MEIDSYSIQATVEDNQGNRFELTDQMKKWGYELLINGQVPRKGNQFMTIYNGPGGMVYGADNNGSVVRYVNGGWEYVVKDNKDQANALLQQHGQSLSGMRTLPAVQQTLGNQLKDLAVSEAKTFIDQKLASQQLPPPESGGVLATGQSPVTQHGDVVVTEDVSPTVAGIPIMYLVGGVLALIALVFLYKRFS